MVTRKSPAQIALMRRAGRVVAEMHDECTRAARPGVTTAELDRVAREVLDRRGARSNFLGYHGFPAVACVSVNEEVVHGIPGPRVLAEGDIVSIDCGAIVEGWHADAAVTVGVGEVDDETRRLVDTARRALEAQIAEIVEGARLGDVGAACEEVVEAAGFSVTEGYTGHGIGTAMHEPPEVRNEGPRGRGLRLRVGHVLALEPMVNAGTPDTRVLSDGWTVVTADGRKASHFEHTVAVTEQGAEVLTIP
jgi:methionyl aminopeptidase